MLKLSLFVVLAVSLTSTAGAVDPDTAWCNIQGKFQKFQSFKISLNYIKRI